MPSRVQLKLISGPVNEPVTVAEAKHYGLDAPDDTTLERAIKAARELAEAYTGRAFMEQTLQLAIYDAEPGEAIELPRPALLEVTSVTDGSGNAIDPSDYEVDTDCEPGLIEFSDSHDKVVVIYKARMWESPDDVPEYVKTALCKAAFLVHDNRASTALPEVARQDLMPLKISFLS